MRAHAGLLLASMVFHGRSAAAVLDMPAARACIEGWLTQKGTDLWQYWAITDDSGAAWLLTGLESLPRSWIERHAGQRVAFEGSRSPARPLKGFRVTAAVGIRCQAGGGTSHPRSSP